MNKPDDSTSINSNWVNTIYEVNKDNILIGTNEGLNLFNRQTKNFRRIYYQDSLKSALLNYKVETILEDRLTGNLYVGSDNKILIFDKEKQILTDKNRISELKLDLGEIQSFCQAVDGKIWIGHSRGLAKFNSLKNTLEIYKPFPDFGYNVENDWGNLVEDDNSFIWYSLNNNPGLFCFDPQNEHFKIYKSGPDKQTSLSASTIWSVYIDRSGIIWAGTGWAGLNKWDRSKQKFERVSFNTNDGKRFNTVYTIVEDQNEIIWFGTDDGLNSFNRFTNEFKKYQYNIKAKSNTVTHIYNDKSGVIWFGTFTNGLGKFDTVNGSFHFYSNDANDSTSISNNDVRFILPDKNDFLWIGTRLGGLNRFNKKTGKFKNYTHDPNNSQSLISDQVNCIYENRNGKLWIGTNSGGLNSFDRINESFKLFDIKREFVAGTVTTIYEDRKGNFWIGTYHSGIQLFDRDKGIFIYKITEKDGLANNYVRAILEDNSGNLWISSEKGISRFNPKTHNIKNYLNSDSFIGNRHLKNSACKTSTGEMLFGTSDGFIIFHPDSIKDDPVPPKVVISNVSLFNRPGEKIEYGGFISEMDELNISYDENHLRFDYVGLHLGEPAKNQYKYMLENFDDNWVDAGTQRNATYTNLHAGEYVFRVTASNRDGVWNEEGASLRIIIPPPFWATWWAYILYVMFIVSLFTGVTRFYLNRQRLKKQLELEHEHTEKLEEIDKMKSRFFANISHEFRTPLTLILGPSENIITEAPSENATKQAGAIKRNANHLLVLINQLLDLSKLEAGKLELKASKDNIVSFIKGITMSFESVAERKDITLRVIPDKEQIELYFDKEKMTKTMTNLLSNAFKFTKDGGQITVTINDSDVNAVRIKVRDTGRGIAKEELPKLFDRFYQVDSSHTREHEGTGIGLALTKELVELHHGTISVDSKFGEWTEFTVDLPLGNKHLKDNEIVKTEEPTKDDLIIDVKEFVLSAVVEGIDTEVISE
ncbi:MAG: ATP-binding protein, partial [Ignavibacteria bacterium]|nr:ATP-binding protein [Ignavibacteria bacterium]